MQKPQSVLYKYFNYFLKSNRSSVSEMLGVVAVCRGVVVWDFLFFGVAKILGEGEGV